MRWKKSNPKINDIKIKRKFLFFPVCINDEYRWLESVNIKYKFSTVKVQYIGGSYHKDEWVKIEFMN